MVSAPLTAVRSGAPAKERLRLWIRILRASRLIEAVLRERLKTRFDTTLPRFDVLSALDRAPEGMAMSDISRFLLVSNGNVTGIVERLVSDGLASRAKRDGDRRTSIVKLTPAGKEAFAAMAEAHERWIDELLGSLPEDEARMLAATLKTFESNWEGEA
ncbi:MarR family winged helix-turn-helix transcriptional regulator [Nitratireductor sp. ZSWI3]|uniref:MarR family winged helix-turn-helix transcriptional regulator n=1 Tax=Nitratireductor sp. ZSWI3 TaxID=2966359 RepID=UPI0021503118|nr:MarR family transcriptional regulator [Nitratireductor sp. ZSWI3]MCR4266976.1 MarR family transcriptional regulator [Nitratireductor sp. ZSWI3]